MFLPPAARVSLLIPSLWALGCSESDQGGSEGTTGTQATLTGTTGTGGATATAASNTTGTTGATTTSGTTGSTTTASVTTSSSSSSAATGSTASSGSTGSSGGTTASTGTAAGGATSMGSGGASSTATTQGAGGTGGGSGEFTLTSSELTEGGMFMDKHTCAVAGFDNDESPPLAWSGAPANTQSFAIVFLDTTLTEEGNTLGYHSVIWDIPASVSELPGNLPDGATITDPVSAKQFNPSSPSYLGPCPNFGGGGGETHTYTFTIYAMPEAETTALAGINDVQQLESAIQAVALGSASLSGTSNASPP